MFTGIVQNLGTLKKKTPVKAGLRLTIQSSLPKKDLQKGSSVSVNGVCLTVEHYDSSRHLFTVTLIPETLKKTCLKDEKVESKLNLEPSLLISDAVSGHLVLGHVDFCGRVLQPAPLLRIEIPFRYLRYFPEKASVAVHGVSLTVAKRDKKSITVGLIPETLKSSNLKNLKLGDRVHIEIDVLARYLKSFLSSP